MVWLLELLVLSPPLGGIQLLLLFLILLIKILLENLILDSAKAFRGIKVKKRFKTHCYCFLMNIGEAVAYQDHVGVSSVDFSSVLMILSFQGLLFTVFKLGYSSIGRSLLCIARYSFSPLQGFSHWVFLGVGFDEA